MEWTDPFKALMWAMDRPQQAIFQGARRGADAFGRNLRQGNEMNALASAAMSAPEFLRGAAQGLTGTGRDIYGSGLVSGLEEHIPFGLNEDNPEWNRPHVEALANFLNAAASPADLLAPVGRAAKVPYATYKNLSRMAPEYREAAMRLGTPMSKATDYIKQGVGQFGDDMGTLFGGMRDKAKLMGRALDDPMGGMQPVMSAASVEEKAAGPASIMDTYRNMRQKAKDLGGVYGHYIHAPSSTASPRPMVIRSDNPDMADTVEKILGGGAGRQYTDAGQVLQGLAYTLPDPGINRNPLNMIFATMAPTVEDMGNKVLGHEIGHYLSRLLRGSPLQSPKNINLARGQLADFAPSTRSHLRPAHVSALDEAGDRYNTFKVGLEGQFPQAAANKLGAGYKPLDIPEELFADVAGGRLNVPGDPLSSGIQRMTKDPTWSVEMAWNPRGLPNAPTVPFAQVRRSTRNWFEEEPSRNWFEK